MRDGALNILDGTVGDLCSLLDQGCSHGVRRTRHSIEMSKLEQCMLVEETWLA